MADSQCRNARLVVVNPAEERLRQAHRRVQARGKVGSEVSQDCRYRSVLRRDGVRAADHDGQFDDTVLGARILFRGGARIEDGPEDPRVLGAVVRWRSRDEIAETRGVDWPFRVGREDKIDYGDRGRRVRVEMRQGCGGM